MISRSPLGTAATVLLASLLAACGGKTNGFEGAGTTNGFGGSSPEVADSVPGEDTEVASGPSDPSGGAGGNPSSASPGGASGMTPFEICAMNDGCYNQFYSTCATCCPPESEDPAYCEGKPDFSAGLCTPVHGSFCSCDCNGGKFVCAC